MKIELIRVLEILDSRGNPTVQVEVSLAGGVRGKAQVPSGASTGHHEALELRDGDPGRYAGKGVLRAVGNVERVLGPAVIGMDVTDQAGVDERLVREGSGLGAKCNARDFCAQWLVRRRWREGCRSGNISRRSAAQRFRVPMVNIISGGLHAGRNIEFQDFLVIPREYAGISEALEAVVRVHRKTGELLAKRGCVLTGVADEGGWGPLLDSNEEAAAILRQAITESGAEMDIALDVAASHFMEGDLYRLEGRELSAAGMAALLADWIPRYGITSVEDALGEDDWDGWRDITSVLGSKVALVGDDLFATNLTRLDRGIREGAANAVLVKMNQIGTLTETFRVIDRAREAGYGAVISARSGETEDAFLADLAVASGAGQIKVGSVTRSDRLAKYNRLLEIEKWEM